MGCRVQKILLIVLCAIALSAFAVDAMAASKRVTLNDATLLVSIAEDPEFTFSKMTYEVRKNGKTFKLKFLGKAPDGLATGTRVRIKNAKRLNASALLVGSGGFEATPALLAAGVGGIRQALVLIIKSATSVTSASTASIASAMQGADTWYYESSYQMLSMKNDRDGNGTADIYTVSIPNSSAGAGESSAFTFCNAAKSAASSQAGITPSLWNHIICILPPDMNYGWFGQAYVGGSDVVISGKYAGGYPGGYTHELGHNLGMHHSNTPGTEYGESACVMGGNAGSARRDFNGPHKSHMGWIGVVTAGNGTYTLNAVEAQPSQRTSSETLLKVRDTVAAQDLYISYRAPLGTFGPGLGTSANRTSIHSWPGGSSQTILEGTIGDGQIFSRNGVVITQISHTMNAAVIQVGAQCTSIAPGMTLAPSSQTATAVETKQYTLTLTNKDINCGSGVTYSLSASAPGATWSAQLSSAVVTVSPGQSASVSLDLTPPLDTAAGTYAFTVVAQAAGHPSASASGSYIFDNIAPAQITNLAVSSPRKGKALLIWSAPSDIGSGIAAYDIFRNGARVASPATMQYTDTPGNGTFSYQVQARDRAGNTSPLSNTAQITFNGGGGKRK